MCLSIEICSTWHICRMIARRVRTTMFLGIGICLVVTCLCYVYCLTCLHCADIQSPRHCKNVMECAQGEICHVHQKMNEYGEILFDLGCTLASMCSNRTHGNHATCDDCCNSDLCNAAGCGQPGYPQNRGPICYSCSSQTTPGSCYGIDFCGSHEVCMYHEEREFGDSVYTYKCAVLAQCEHYKLDNVAIVGRSLSEEQRSVTETVVHRCCYGDLCNKNCSVSDCKEFGLYSTTGGYSVRPEGTTQPINVNRYKDCKEVRLHSNVSGVYSVRPEGTNTSIKVYCDMTTDGGGWTVFQRRVNGSVDFYQNFSSYENGFGNVQGEFWLGLKYIHVMTYNAKTELRIDLMAADGSTAFEVFPNFRLSAAPQYTLTVDPGHGTAGDFQGFSYNNGSAFSTYDTDTSFCAHAYHGGWWYSDCQYVNLNGRYVTPGSTNSSGMHYYEWKQHVSMKETQMLFRRV